MLWLVVMLQAMAGRRAWVMWLATSWSKVSRAARSSGGALGRSGAVPLLCAQDCRQFPECCRAARGDHGVVSVCLAEDCRVAETSRADRGELPGAPRMIVGLRIVRGVISRKIIRESTTLRHAPDNSPSRPRATPRNPAGVPGPGRPAPIAIPRRAASTITPHPLPAPSHTR